MEPKVLGSSLFKIFIIYVNLQCSGFHCDISMHAYNVLGSYPLPLPILLCLLLPLPLSLSLHFYIGFIVTFHTWIQRTSAILSNFPLFSLSPPIDYPPNNPFMFVSSFFRSRFYIGEKNLQYLSLWVWFISFNMTVSSCMLLMTRPESSSVELPQGNSELQFIQRKDFQGDFFWLVCTISSSQRAQKWSTSDQVNFCHCTAEL
jgi:hypothetical protein